jgi:hypothetical protein
MPPEGNSLEHLFRVRPGTPRLLLLVVARLAGAVSTSCTSVIRRTSSSRWPGSAAFGKFRLRSARDLCPETYLSKFPGMPVRGCRTACCCGAEKLTYRAADVVIVTNQS